MLPYKRFLLYYPVNIPSNLRSSSGDLSGAFKLVLVGDSGVGKSCLLEKLVSGGGSKNAFISTIGVDVRTHQVDLREGHSCKLQASSYVQGDPSA